MNRKDFTKGFTLVELSIVLVIIGLLIGGILVSQSMINTTKIQKITRQLSQYDIAVVNFKTKFAQLPGDSTLFTPPGNNDKLVNQYNSGGWKYEYSWAWAHLSQGVDIKNSAGTSYTSWNPLSDPVTETNAPRLDIRQNLTDPPALIIFDRDLGVANYFWYWEAPSGVFLNPPARDPLLAVDVAALDAKLDDGLPAGGKVLGVTLGSGTPSQCNVSGQYNTSNTGYICSLYVQFGATNGDASF